MWSTLWKALHAPVALNVQLDLTNACNLRCSHCYHPHHRNSQALTTDEWLHALERVHSLIQKLHAQPRFFLCGGEPTLAASFSTILPLLRKKYPRAAISVLTNGLTSGHILKNGESIADLITNNLASVQVSLDGATHKTHDALRGQNSFARALVGIRRSRYFHRALASILWIQ